MEVNENAINAEIKRDEAGHFLPGNPPGPGRPKGQSMKEFWKQRFAEMTPEDKAAWIRNNKVSGDVIWKMAEGQPRQDTDITSNGEALQPILVKFLNAEPDRDTSGVQETL